MAVRKVRNHGKWVWMARVAYQGRRRAAFKATKDAARDAEAELRQALKTALAEEATAGARPATLRQLLEFYVADPTARGKGRDTVGRAEETPPAPAAIAPQHLKAEHPLE